jgi:hypothetical protein
MNHHNCDSDRRRRRALQRLGTDHPICCGCLETNPHCLELHHIAGQAFGNEVAIVCRNCHRKLSDAQDGHPTKLAVEPVTEERIGHFLLGLGDFLKLIADKLIEFGTRLIRFTEAKLVATSGDRS